MRSRRPSVVRRPSVRHLQLFLQCNYFCNAILFAMQLFLQCKYSCNAIIFAMHFFAMQLCLQCRYVCKDCGAFFVNLSAAACASFRRSASSCAAASFAAMLPVALPLFFAVGATAAGAAARRSMGSSLRGGPFCAAEASSRETYMFENIHV